MPRCTHCQSVITYFPKNGRCPNCGGEMNNPIAETEGTLNIGFFESISLMKDFFIFIFSVTYFCLIWMAIFNPEMHVGLFSSLNIANIILFVVLSGAAIVLRRWFLVVFYLVLIVLLFTL